MQFFTAASFILITLGVLSNARRIRRRTDYIPSGYIHEPADIEKQSLLEETEVLEILSNNIDAYDGFYDRPGAYSKGYTYDSGDYPANVIYVKEIKNKKTSAATTVNLKPVTEDVNEKPAVKNLHVGNSVLRSTQTTDNIPKTKNAITTARPEIRNVLRSISKNLEAKIIESITSVKGKNLSSLH